MCLEHFLQTKANIGGYVFPNITMMSLFSNAAVLSLSQAFHLTLKSSPFYSHSLENKFQDFSLIFILATAATDSIKQLYSLEKCL